MNKPHGFNVNNGHILLEQRGPVVSQVLWTSSDGLGTSLFKITQFWHYDDEEYTIYLFPHELKKLAGAARDWEDNDV